MSSRCNDFKQFTFKFQPKANRARFILLWLMRILSAKVFIFTGHARANFPVRQILKGFLIFKNNLDRYRHLRLLIEMKTHSPMKTFTSEYSVEPAWRRFFSLTHTRSNLVRRSSPNTRRYLLLSTHAKPETKTRVIQVQPIPRVNPAR